MAARTKEELDTLKDRLKAVWREVEPTRLENHDLIKRRKRNYFRNSYSPLRSTVTEETILTYRKKKMVASFPALFPFSLLEVSKDLFRLRKNREYFSVECLVLRGFVRNASLKTK